VHPTLDSLEAAKYPLLILQIDELRSDCVLGKNESVEKPIGKGRFPSKDEFHAIQNAEWESEVEVPTKKGLESMKTQALS